MEKSVTIAEGIELIEVTGEGMDPSWSETRHKIVEISQVTLDKLLKRALYPLDGKYLVEALDYGLLVTASLPGLKPILYFVFDFNEKPDEIVDKIIKKCMRAPDGSGLCSTGDLIQLL